MLRFVPYLLLAACAVNANVVLVAPQAETCDGYLFPVIIQQVHDPPFPVYNRQRIFSP